LDPVDEGGRHLHLAHAGLGLGVADHEAAVCEAEVADAQVAQRAGTHAAAAERLDDRAVAAIRWPIREAQMSRSAPPPNGSRCSPTPNAKAASTTS
jgi:hypothetical protein